MNKAPNLPTKASQRSRTTQGLKRAAALAYKPLGADDAPLVVAKGEGSIAEAILQQAEAYNIPVLRNPELSDLLAGVETGHQIPTEAFFAVAEILRYVYALKGEDLPIPQKQR